MSTKVKPPVAIGGVGGSGTRLIAKILIDLGFHMGADLNESNDNLCFTLLFKRKELWPPAHHSKEIIQAYQIFKQAMLSQTPLNATDKHFIEGLTNDRLQHDSDWLTERKDSILQPQQHINTKNWGWKEPNTHIVLPEILKAEPELKYIHVMRHGLDMAFSSNQNQLALWGELLLGHNAVDKTPESSFEYWCAAHRRVIQTGEKMRENFLLLNYDQLCTNPSEELPKLLNFLKASPSEALYQKLQKLIRVPQSIGRYKEMKLKNLQDGDILTLQKLGYNP